MTSQQLPSDQFAVGEVVIVMPTLPGNHPCEGTIQALPVPYLHRDQNGRLVSPDHYEVILENGLEVEVTHQQLRKRRPPVVRHEVVGWSECPWQPSEVRA